MKLTPMILLSGFAPGPTLPRASLRGNVVVQIRYGDSFGMDLVGVEFAIWQYSFWILSLFL